VVNTREIAKEYRLSHWAQVMNERAQSGLSIKAFCKQVGICGNTYFYWQRRLRETACQELLPDSKVNTKVPPVQVRPVQAAVLRPEKDLIPKQAVIPNGWAVCDALESKSNEVYAAVESASKAAIYGDFAGAICQPPGDAISIELGKCRIRVNPGADPELLANVCRTLLPLC